ncbi:flagellar hook-length control protein FliK [Shewanella sp. C32]|uniref:Flagellar hook-length control protein FliK n=1 Tax=Shewanella electrica TaxID=515560 RepID=A0ABT2FJH2_9GAMM|nr:flagellar hook-length control protein FliK [Shewanella electrica]MCH1923264.1 flagellar hook-length control protein FliK [Shewanella electrica]MCS4555361.1 flagellar hook-length control protein FliK [Shewanella electrica]
MAMNVLNTINLTNVNSAGAGSSQGKVSRSDDTLDSSTSVFPAVGEQLPQSSQGDEQALVVESSSSNDTTSEIDQQSTDKETTAAVSDSLPSSWLSSLFILPTATTAPDAQPSSVVGDMAQVDVTTAQLPPPLVDAANTDAAPLPAAEVAAIASAIAAPLVSGRNGANSVNAADVSATQPVADLSPLLANATPPATAEQPIMVPLTVTDTATNTDIKQSSPLSADAVKQNSATLQTSNSLLAASTTAAESTVSATAATVSANSNGLAANVMALSMALQQQLNSQSSADTPLNAVRVELPALHMANAQLTPALDSNANNGVQRFPLAADAAIGQQLLNVLKDRVQLQLDNQQQVAQIRLDPPRLGSIEVRISVEGDRTIVHLNASQSSVREAMATTAEQLRTTLMNKLGSDVTVLTSSDSNGQSSQQAPQYLADQIDSNSLALDDEPLTQAHQQQGWINRLA